MGLRSFIGGVARGVGRAVSSVVSGASRAIGAAVSAGSRLFKSAVSAVKQMASKVHDWKALLGAMADGAKKGHR